MEQINEILEILTAFKENKILEILNDFGNWETFNGTSLELTEYVLKKYKIRIKPDKKYRPYSDVTEFLKASKKHGPHIIWCEEYIIPNCSNNGIWFKVKPRLTLNIIDRTYTFKNLCENCKWEDNTPCGILE